MSTPIRLRASDLPVALKCPGSTRLPVVKVLDDHEAARLGTAFHSAIRPIFDIGQPLWDDVEHVAQEHKVSPEQLRVLLGMAVKMWPALAPKFARSSSEVPFELAPGDDAGFVLTGTVDAIHVMADDVRTVHIMDWKSGYKDSDYSEQMRAYMALAILDDPDLERAEATVAWVREQEVEPYRMTREQAVEWVTNLVRVIVGWDGTLVSGPHCGRCRRSHECSEANLLARRDAAILMGVDAGAVESIRSLPPETKVRLYNAAKQAAAQAESVLESIKAAIVADGPVNDGKTTLMVKDENGKRQIDTAKAWPILQDAGFTDAEFAQVVEISGSAVDLVIGSKAERGQKGKAIEAVKTKLTAAGAVVQPMVRKLTSRRSQEPAKE